jgi:hypothetical protein
MTNSEQASAFMSLSSGLPGFKKSDYEMVEKGILAGNYQFDPSDNIVITSDGWKIQIHEDGRFVPLDES